MAHSDNSFNSLLQKFDYTLQKCNPVNYTRLQPPLPEEEIDKYLNNFGLTNDENLKSLFSWKNGFDFSDGEDSSFQIFYFGAMMSLEHISLYLKNETEPEFNVRKEIVFVPLTTNGSGDSMLYNIMNEDYGKIHLYSVPLFFIDNPISYYDSLFAMIETTIKAYEEGIFKYNKADEWLNIDIDQYYILSRKMNKNSEYWKIN